MANDGMCAIQKPNVFIIYGMSEQQNLPSKQSEKKRTLKENFGTY